MSERERERGIFCEIIHRVAHLKLNCTHTFSVVTPADMEAVEKVIVVMLSDIHTASTQLYSLLHLYI